MFIYFKISFINRKPNIYRLGENYSRKIDRKLNRFGR